MGLGSSSETELAASVASAKSRLATSEFLKPRRVGYLLDQALSQWRSLQCIMQLMADDNTNHFKIKSNRVKNAKLRSFGNY